jgi:hypothetical protein
MKNDISKNTIVILLVLAVLISVIGTWIVLTQETTTYYGTDQQSGIVSFEVKSNAPPQQVTGDAVIAFGIKK